MFDDFQDLDEEEGGGVGALASSYEPDEPEGLESPRDSTFFVGHEKNEQALINLINSGAMPHALIFAGTKGIGKSTLAFRLARCLLKHGTAESNQDSLFGDVPAEITSLSVAKDDPVFSKVASGGHPDMLTLEHSLDPKKTSKNGDIDVYTARKVAPFLRMTSSAGGWRVVIVDNADTMNRNAQNALLKILEEPPKNTILIVVAHRLGAMIPTIRSRCRVMHFDPLAAVDLATLMSKEVGGTLSDKDKNILNFLAQGSIGRAQKLIASGGLDIADKVLGMVEHWPNFNWVDVHHLSDQCGRMGQDSNFGNVESTFNTIFETLVFAKAKGQGQEGQNALQEPLNKDVCLKILESRSLEALTDIYDKLTAHFRQARFSNLDKRQAVLEAFNIIT